MQLDMLNLKKFIQMKSVDGDLIGNQQAIHFVTDFLQQSDCQVQILGHYKSQQPSIVGHYQGHNSQNKLVIYGHYDVAPIMPMEDWSHSDPFVLEEKTDRFYARGIADNKGTLFARLQAFKTMVKNNQALPEILWLIQGEEEVINKERVAKAIFKTEIKKFGGQVFLEETGFNDLKTKEQVAFLWSSNLKENELTQWHSLLNKSLSQPRIEYRHLNKLNGTDTCPLLSNLPKNSIYIGFGANDRLHRIHRDNESLNQHKLSLHLQQFTQFLLKYALFETTT
ncbi:MAG: M20/M25/M40 family metallo-hydrolase [Sulfurovaceae bacterium]|nr:M20/M25/M40 family metallo-hydrolase [Sulfurovaceae bacterium]